MLRARSSTQLLLFAHLPEAQAFLSSAPWQKMPPLSPHSARLYRWQDCFLLITGQGPNAATQALQLFGEQYPPVQGLINLGIAGSLNPQLAVGTMVQVGYIVPDAKLPAIPLTCLHPTLPAVSLLSVHSPFVHAQRPLGADIVDCELSALVACARQLSPAPVSISSVKYLSDMAYAPVDRNIIRQGAPHYSSQLLAAYRQLLPISE